MSVIKNVAVAGGTGALGSKVVEELVKAGYNVTILTRADSSKPVPDGVASKNVDYTSVESLTPALQGQDAVVSVVGSLAVGGQKPLIDAAVAAGVKRFIPSEFGINTRKARGTTIGAIIQGKIDAVDHLIEKANASGGKFAWTGISTGLFFDSGLKMGGLGLHAAQKTATVYDSGNEPFQTANLHFIGQAVAAVLAQAGTLQDKTANEYIEIASFTPTQNELVAAAEQITGEKWPVTHKSAAEAQKTGETKLANKDFSAFVDLLAAWQYADGAGHAGKGGNALLGLQEEDLQATLKAFFSK